MPVHEKKSKFSKEKYRPISILPNISRVYERCLYDQITNFFEVSMRFLQGLQCTTLPVIYDRKTGKKKKKKKKKKWTMEVSLVHY